MKHQQLFLRTEAVLEEPCGHSFGRDADGEIYIVDRGGEVFKIVPDGPAAACPAALPAAAVPGRVTLVLALLLAASLTLAIRATNR
jgi:hypothetical protein